ncbi:hypothetical protein [Variovorax sp. PMC12]|uniref:hypothetical protein n=1 Tax=Variovorax sp. PMC12 TaxID=2126319 RepID=UPI000D132B1B|nr:hypothetical protein [Variovorax sp. PMC12]AVQ81639.1 hypothetical protein C4F17_12155 [Variovorax sp. PMC12]
MTDSAQGNAAAILARTKRIEIQHFADGGMVRRMFDRYYGNTPARAPAPAPAAEAPAQPASARLSNISDYAGNTGLEKRMKAAGLKDGGPVKKGGAAAMLAQMPASHAKAKPMEHGGPVHGPGGPTEDKVPIWASAGEFMLPADTTAAVGKEKLEALIDATHTPTRSPAEKMGRLARADGGAIDPGAVTRVGNSYSGGSVTGNIAVNGAAPGGTVSTVDSFRAPPPPAAPPVLGAPAALTPIALKPAAPAPAVAPPSAAAPLDYANRNAAFNTGADARTAMMSAPGVRRSNLAAAPAAGTAAASLAARPVQSIAGYANGGEIDDPRKPLPTFASPEAAALALGGMSASARTDMQRAADVQLASLSPTAAAVASPKPYVAEIPRGRYESAAPYPDAPAPAPAAPVQPPAAPAVEAQPVDVAPTAAPAPAAAAPAAPTPQAQLATLPATGVAATPARANPLGSMADTNAQLANLQASNASIPQGGATIIDGAGAEADRRAQFNEQANLRNALNSSVMTRRGAVPNEVAVQAALLPIDARARMAQVAAKEAGDTQRATIQERGTDARAKLADARAQQELGINQQRLSLEGKKVTLDANRDDRAAAAAEPALALAQRKASLQAVVADPNSTPAQRQAATQQIAGMEGKELLGHAPPAGYERTPDGNLKFIKGGPADPDTPKGKNNLTDTQAKALQFGSRMQEANEIFDKLEKDGKLFSTPGANNPITGGIVNQFNTAAAQQLDQAKRNFVNAVLRRESGAAIAPSEFDSADKQYFPQPGDSAEVVKQKRANRELSMRGILAEVPDADARIAKIRPGAAAAQAAPVTSPADHAKLPVGATYIAPDGTTRRKS